MNNLAIQKASMKSAVSFAPLPEVVQALDFDRLKHKFTTTSDAGMTSEEWDTAELEYRRFLVLKLIYPGISLVPSKQVTKIWHAHILDTRAYREDCEKVFGRYIDYYPYFGIYGADDEKSLQNLIAQTTELYKHHFGPHPTGSTESDNRSEKCVCQEVTA